MDRTERRKAPSDIDDTTFDRRLQCLCSWLERASQRESYAVHARLILPISALTVGATLAASLLGEAPHFALGLMTLSLGCALVGFLLHRRNCQIWKDVARRVQAEQRLLVDPARAKD